MPTAYLSASLLKELTDVSVSPGAGNTGYPLVWNNASGRFELAVLGVAGGGTGTSNGSITGTGALTFAAGGTNQSINITPSGTGQTIFSRGIQIVQSTSQDTRNAGLFISKGDGFYYLRNTSPELTAFAPSVTAKAINSLSPSVQFIGIQSNVGDQAYGVVNFIARNSTSDGPLPSTDLAFTFFSGDSTPLLQIRGSGDLAFLSTTESTSTTTGAVRIDGGLGVAKNANIGGNLRFAGGTVPATAASAGTTGDIRYDGSHLYICTATNTWVRTALSTW